MPRRALLLLCALAAVAAGCGGSGSKTTTTTAAASKPRPATVWLCFPGKAADPCAGDLTTTIVRADGSKTVVHTKAAAHPPIDCFYVYPTVSDENRGNSDL